MKEIELIEVRSELGAGTRGASLGIDAIKIAALNQSSLYFKDKKIKNVQVENHVLLDSMVHKYSKRIDSILKVYNRVCEAVSGIIVNDDIFPVVLAGDHSTAGGTIAGIKKAFPDKRLGVIWIDAHADLHSPYTTPSGNMHGMPLAISLNEDNVEYQRNEPDESTIILWNKLKNMVGVSPKINYSDLVFITLRDTEKEENAIIEKNNIKCFSVEELKEKGVDAIAKLTLSHLDDCDIIYISFDVDSMDSSLSKGTGTPVPNGISVNEAKELIDTLVKNPRVCCLEVVEVNPILDNENAMAENAFTILNAVSQTIIKK
jgi:arginase